MRWSEMMPLRRLLMPLVAAIAAALALAGPAGAAVKRMVWAPPDQAQTAADLPIYKQLHVQVVEQSLNWSNIAATQPADPRNPADPAYGWTDAADYLYAQAPSQGFQVALMLDYAPGWANGGQT